MPIAINSPARNLFLLGSSGAQVVTNFFKAIDQAASSDSYYLPSELRYYEGPGEEDRFVLAGTAQDNRPDLFGWIENRNSSGTSSFENRVVSTQNGTDTTLLALELDSNNKLIAAGKTGTVPWISRYALDGALEWSSTTTSANVEYRGIASDSNGQYYACGVNNSAGIESFVEKFDASGNPGWGKRATLVGRDVILTAIDANNRGQVVAVGYIEDDSYNKGYIVKIDTATGDIVWDRTIETSHDVDCTDVFIDTNDQIYITANIERQGIPGTWTGVLLKYTAEGNLIWQTESDPNTNDTVTFDKVQADGETEAVVVFGTYFDINNSVTQGMITKYARNGDLVWRRTLESSEDSAFNFSNLGIDSDPSYYYILFTDDSISQGGGTPDRYTYGKISSSGNGLGAFQYNDGSGQTIDYVYTNMGDRIAKLVDGSVRQDTTELMTYPFSANKILFDDLATKITNKKRQLDSADPLVYSGSPAIRPPDNRSYELTEPLELNGTSDRIEDFNFTTGGKSELSVECWFQVDDITTSKPTSRGYIWDETPSANGASLRLSTDQKITTFAYAGGSVVLAQKPDVVQTGVWYHVVSTFGNGQTKLYVNGELEHTVNGTFSTIVDTGSYPFTIGASTDNTGTIGDAIFTTPGQYEFTVPDGVTDVSMVLVGGGGGGATSTTSANGQAGGGGGGGALMWRNGYTVSSGDVLYVTVGEGGSGGTYTTGAGGGGNDDGTAGGDSYVRLNSHSGTIIARAGGGGKGIFNSTGGNARFPNAGVEYSSTYGGGGSVSGGGNGGEGGVGQPGFASGGGGGAGGYSGDGGRGQNGQLSNPESMRTAGQGGGGGGGGASNSTGTSPTTAGGGGVGIYGQGTSGGTATSSNTSSQSAIQSFAGSGGTSTDPNTTPAEKGYGGGGTGGEDDASAKAADGGSGAVRIIWGAGRSFPSTDVGAASAGADTREYLDGRVGELRAYDRILTAEDVVQAYNATKTKYTGEQADIAPKIGPGIVYDNNLLLNYDFGNQATYDTRQIVETPPASIPSTEQKITASDGAVYDNFGEAVAVGSGRIVVGARGDAENTGSAYIFDLDGNQLAKITASDGATGDRFGISVAVGSNKIVVGAYLDDDNGSESGAAYIFDLNGNQLAKIIASDGAASDNFGYSVAVGSSRIVVGAIGDDSKGAAYIFDLDGNQLAKITASDGDAGDNFGRSVAIGSDRIVVGAWSDDDNGSASGSAYIYDLDGTNEIKITASDGAAFDYYGWSVSVGSNKIVVGSWRDADNGNLSGSAYIYDLDGTNEIKITPSDGAGSDLFGYSVAIGLDKIVVGAYQDRDNGSNSGSAYIFDLAGNELAKIIASDGDAGDNFGRSVAIGSDRIVVGAWLDEENGFGSGSAYIYTLLSSLNTVKNLSSSSYTGTINGNTTFNPAGYFEFDGTGDYIDITTLAPLADTSAVTMEAWVNVDTLTNLYQCVGTWERTTNHWQFTYSGDTNYNLSLGVAGSNDSVGVTSAPATGSWQHVVATWNGGSLSTLSDWAIYVNGVAQTIQLTGSTGTAGNDSYIGTRQGLAASNMLDGKMGEIRYYSRALSATEVSQNFNATRAKYGV